MADTPTGATPTTTPAAPPAVPDSVVLRDGTWHMKGIVDGKEVVLPLNEVQTRLQKDVASEQRFAAAAAKEAEIARREAEISTQRKFWELAQRSEHGDAAATEEALRMLGREPTPQTTTRQSTPPAQPQAFPVELQEAARLIAAAKEEGIDPLVAIRYAHEGAAGAIRNQVFETVEQTAKLDSVLGPMLRDQRNKDLADVVRSDLQQRVKYLVGVEGADPGPATYARAVREISERVGKLRGTLGGAPSQVPGNTHPGLGPAHSGVPSESHDIPEVVKPVSITTHGMDAWGENFRARLKRNAALQGVASPY